MIEHMHITPQEHMMFKSKNVQKAKDENNGLKFVLENPLCQKIQSCYFLFQSSFLSWPMVRMKTPD